MSRTTADDKSPRLRARHLVLAIIVLLVAIYAFRLYGSNAAFEHEVALLRARGEPVTFSDLKPKLAPGEPNAADLYPQAFAVHKGLPRSIAGVPKTGFAPQDLADARAYVSANRPYYALLEQASRINACSFPLRWDDPIAVISARGPGMEQREAARALTVRAEVYSRDGNPDAALASCGVAFRLAEHAQQMPMVTYQLGGASPTLSMAMDEVRLVLDRGTPCPESCRSLYQQLAAWKWSENWTRAIRGERAWALDYYQWLEHGVFRKNVTGPLASPDALKYNAYLTAGRPWSNKDKTRLLEFYNHVIAAYGLPFGKRSVELDQARALARALDLSHSPFAAGLAGADPALSIPASKTPPEPLSIRLLSIRDRRAAQLAALQIALALTAYRGEHGAYPVSLAELERAGWKLPRDPFTQQPYRYQRRGEGFIVYSVGPDGKDDGGIAWTSNREERGLPYDFVFEVGAKKP